MSSTEEISSLALALKEHLLINEGKVVYWGEDISLESIRVRHREQSEAIRSSEKFSSDVDRNGGLLRSARNDDQKSRAEQLQILRDHTIGDCHRCPLGNTRIKLVFGVGNPGAEVMFVGEGPGFDEDRKGEPFVGKAGQLLDKILAAIGLDRTKVYIANIVKCHPMINPADPERRGNDRPPSPEEMEECLPFLKQQIQIINPRFIVTLGAVATKTLLARREGISALRGRFFDLSINGDSPDIKILPTFHPAALLRDETLKKPVWEDMKMLRDALGVIASDQRERSNL